MLIQGTPVVVGMAYGPAIRVHSPQIPAPGGILPVDRRDGELRRFEVAAAAVGQRLMDRALATVGTASDILFMTSALATDKGIRREVAEVIGRGSSATDAVVAATATFADRFRLAGGLMAERVADLADVRDRIIAELEGLPEPGIPVPREPSVLLANELAPADAAGLDPAVILAVVTRFGGPTSHTAIICRQIGIPCVVAARHIDAIQAGEPVLVDGATGRVETAVDPELARGRVDADARWRRRVAKWRGPAITRDGRHVELLVNVQDGAGAATAAEGAAEGVGLLRTELCFLNEASEPDVDRQTAAYRKVLDAFPEGKVVVRTLDAGSDKPIAFATVSGEDNPALGVRGLRVRQDHPEIIDHQLEAIALAAEGRCAPTWVMAPMVATLEEAEWFVERVRRHGENGPGLKAGIMVEVPAVALQARAFLQVVDFVSIGTNDLAQYVMAADRLSPHLAELTDPWQPAVLALIASTAREGMLLNKPVGVCGEAAADPFLACVLVGMGVTSLSMAPPQVPLVGAQLSSVTYEDCKRAAAAALGARDAMAARAAAREALGFAAE